VRQPVNTADPHRSLLTPLYNYDIERAIRERARSVRGSVRLPKSVQVAPINDADKDSKKSTGSRGSQLFGSRASTPV